MPARPSRRFGPWVGPASPPHLFCETNPFCGAPRAVQPRHLRQQRKRARHAVCSQDMGNGCYQDIGYTLPTRRRRCRRGFQSASAPVARYGNRAYGMTGRRRARHPVPLHGMRCIAVGWDTGDPCVRPRAIAPSLSHSAHPATPTAPRSPECRSCCGHSGHNARPRACPPAPGPACAPA